MTKYGVRLPDLPGTGPPDQFEHVAGLAVSAEANGFDAVWVGDHRFTTPQLRPSTQPIFESYTLLGALAARTERVQLGALVAGAGYRNPGVLAKLTTTLDVLSGGRAVLGIGAPAHRDQQGGGDREGFSDAARFVALEDALLVCRAMFRDDEVTLAGGSLRLEHARNLPRPIQSGGPMVLVAADDEGTLRLAARFADKCNLTGDVSAFADQVAALHYHCRELGRDPSEIDVTWTAPLVLTTSAGQGRQMIEAGAAGGFPPGLDGLIVGHPEQVPDLIAGHIAAGADEVYFSLSDTGAEPAAIALVATALGLTDR
jgi:alkanesulfonate monooxygenase SsuD/methylene tetrahydromethanopterin reductase-like flavin-dependent oxidoreductase (luciferase family)